MSLSQNVCVLNVTLQPGQTLTINAENYTILLDKANILDCHVSGWIDKLTRETESIQIQAAAGTANLTAEMRYRDRYL